VVTEVNSISLPDKKRLHDIGELNEILANSWQSYDFVIFRIYLADEWQSICDAASNDFVTTYSAIAVGVPGDRHPHRDSLVCKPLKVRGRARGFEPPTPGATTWPQGLLIFQDFS
jgi:hypothetical protein